MFTKLSSLQMHFLLLLHDWKTISSLLYHACKSKSIDSFSYPSSLWQQIYSWWSPANYFVTPRLITVAAVLLCLCCPSSSSWMGWEEMTENRWFIISKECLYFSFSLIGIPWALESFFHSFLVMLIVLKSVNVMVLSWPFSYVQEWNVQQSWAVPTLFLLSCIFLPFLATYHA